MNIKSKIRGCVLHEQYKGFCRHDFYSSTLCLQDNYANSRKNTPSHGLDDDFFDVLPIFNLLLYITRFYYCSNLFIGHRKLLKKTNFKPLWGSFNLYLPYPNKKSFMMQMQYKENR